MITSTIFLNISITGTKLLDTTKYITSEILTNSYVWQLNLTIKILKPNDFGTYICSSINALGKSDGKVRLQGMSTKYF